MIRRGVFAVFIAIFSLLNVSSVFADVNTKGLSTSPIRQDISVTAGKQNSSAFTVGNSTDKPMTINLSVEKFSVSDFSYDYLFQQPDNNWITLGDKQITLQPGKTQKVVFEISIPARTAAGGYYYTLVASSQITSGGVISTIRATSLLYITVDGKLIQTSVLKNDSIPWFITGPLIPYKFDILDTGNVHFSATFIGQLESIFGAGPQKASSSLIFPGIPRTVTGTINSPFWPGVYEAKYGYKVDFANITVEKSALILYAPPWSFVAIVLIIFIALRIRQTAKSRKEKHSKDS